MGDVIKRFNLNNPHDIYEARCAVYKLQNWYSLSSNKKLDTYVWDEDKTVRENRELTVKHNAEIDAEIERRKLIFKESFENLEAAIIDYIMDEFEYEDIKCSKETAEKIWIFCKEQWEDDPHNYISDMCRFYRSIMN